MSVGLAFLPAGHLSGGRHAGFAQPSRRRRFITTFLWLYVLSFACDRRGDFRTYLFSIARNLACKRYRNAHAGLYVDEDEANFAERGQTDRELSVMVAQMVSQLPDLQREVLILFEYEGFSLNEIAVIVNADVGAVKARLHRARERLRRALTPSRRVGTHQNAGRRHFERGGVN